MLTTSPWSTNGDFGYDEGAAVVRTNAAGQTLTDVVGRRGIGFNRAAEQHYLAHGYPAAPLSSHVPSEPGRADLHPAGRLGSRPPRGDCGGTGGGAAGM